MEAKVKRRFVFGNLILFSLLATAPILVRGRKEKDGRTSASGERGGAALAGETVSGQVRRMFTNSPIYSGHLVRLSSLKGG